MEIIFSILHFFLSEETKTQQGKCPAQGIRADKEQSQD